MTKSDTIKELAAALIAFQKEVVGVTKDGTNPHFRSKFATLDNVIATIKTPLIKNGLSFVQLPDGTGLTTILMHKSGEWMSATAELLLDKQTPQGQGSAYTYGRRYALTAMLGLATEDDDGNAASLKRHYDTTPIEEDAEVVVAGADEEPTPKRTAPKKTTGHLTMADKKRVIKDLIDSTALTPLETKEEYEKYVKDNTGLSLVASNYDTIIERLKALN